MENKPLYAACDRLEGHPPSALLDDRLHICEQNLQGVAHRCCSDVRDRRRRLLTCCVSGEPVWPKRRRPDSKVQVLTNINDDRRRSRRWPGGRWGCEMEVGGSDEGKER
jgi:hypothetical protein